MFGFFKRLASQQPATRPSVSEQRGEPILAFVIHKTTVSPIETVKSKLATTHFNHLAATDVSQKGSILTFKLGDDIAAVSHNPVPYPADELLRNAEGSWMLNANDSEQIKTQRAHTVVVLTGGKSSHVNRLLAATQLTGIVSDSPDVLAVFWGLGKNVISPQAFVQFAQKLTTPEMPPIYAWINFRCGTNPDGTTVFATTGMPQLGLMEIEIPSIAFSPGELREWMLNIVLYLLEKGPVLLDGQTIGPDKNTQLKIRHLPSLYGQPGTTIRLLS